MPWTALALARVGTAIALASTGAAGGLERRTAAPPHIASHPTSHVESTYAAARRATAGDVDSIVRFRLPDQFGRLHDATEYRGRPFYLVAAGRGGRTAATAWAAMLPPLLAGEASGRPPAVVPVANLKSVPRWLRGYVRGRFPHDPRQAVLLDWSGALSAQLALDPAQCTVIAVGPGGEPRLRLATLSADTAQVAAFVHRAGAVLADPAPAAP